MRLVVENLKSTFITQLEVVIRMHVELGWVDIEPDQNWVGPNLARFFRAKK